jgi:GT2 family glycosyltransferase
MLPGRAVPSNVMGLQPRPPAPGSPGRASNLAGRPASPASGPLFAPHVSVVIPARNEEAGLAETLRRILDSGYPQLSITVVDDASTDRTSAIARGFEATGRVRVLRNPERLGQVESANRGSRASSADLLFFVDGDCTPAADWIEQGVASFEGGVVGVEGSVEYAVAVPSIRHRVPINPFYNLDLRGSLTVPGRDYANGNFAVRREAFEALGGFDARRYDCGREDTDFGWRLRRLGEIRYNPRMRVVHKEAFWTLRDLLRNARRYAADVRFLKDHGHFPFRRGLVLHPRLLAFLLFPPLAALRLPVRSWKDAVFLPKLGLYLLALRGVIWKTALQERMLVL